MKILIIGGVAGGASAAARLRRLDEFAEIIIIERTGYISYANCGLPYYIGDVITDSDELTLHTPETMYDRFKIDARVNSEAIKINRHKKEVLIKNLKTDVEYVESYDKLILSPGAKAIRPEWSNIPSDKIFTLRSVEDTLKIKKHIDETSAKTAVVIGGGFIGVEAAENLAAIGMDVTLVEYADQILGFLDKDMAAAAHIKLSNNGVNLRLKTAVTALTDMGDFINVHTSNGEYINAEIVLLSIGVLPEGELAKNAGLEQGIKGSISVSEFMQTSDKDIYAVGDAVEINNLISKEKALVSLAGPANKQGRIAADNICGINTVYRGAQGTSIIKLFNTTFAATGINEKTAKQLGLNYEKVILTPNSHASYYVGAKPIVMKILFDLDTKKLLGAQMFGRIGVDKRIDVIATAMFLNADATSLKDIDLAYAPPYSSAKDPVNMAGYVIENVLNEKVAQYPIYEIESLFERVDSVILDIRDESEYKNGHLKCAKHIPLNELRNRLGELQNDKKIYVHCHTGLRSYIACRILQQHGFECYNLSGGYSFYKLAVLDEQNHTFIFPCGKEK